MHEVTRVIAVASLLVGCHPSDMGGPDATLMADAPPTGAGISVGWTATPTIGATGGDGPTVETASFHVDDLRVIGDAGPNDPRTHSDDFNLNWAAPPETTFPNAPPGTYSQLSLSLESDDGAMAFALGGHVTVDTVSHAYTIVGSMQLEVTLPTFGTLDAGGALDLTVLAAFDQALTAVSFDALCNGCSGDATLTLGETDPQMPAFRTALEKDITVSIVTP